MFTKSDIQNNIQETLNSKFESKGFIPIVHPRNLQFKRKFEGGFQSCFFTVLERDKVFWIELSVGVRIDIVEKMANQFTLILEDYQNESHTIMSTYGRILGKPYFRFKIETEEEFALACEKMQDFLEEIGFDFMQDNSQIVAVDRLINRHPEKPSRFIFNESHRCIKGVIIAQMAQNPQLKTLIRAYHIVLQKHLLGHQMLPQYERLIKYIGAFSVN